MLVSAAGLAGDDDARACTPPTGRAALWLALVGVGSGMFNSPNTAAMMGAVPAHRRGIAAGARTLLQNTGAVLSIAFVLAIVTSAVPEGDAVRRSSPASPQGLSRAEARAVHRQHARRAVGARRDLAASAPACACCAPPTTSRRREARGRLATPSADAADAERRAMSASARPSRAERAPERPRDLRIGDVARARRHDAAHDPLLRGDRPAARGAGAPVRARTACTPRPRSSACAR